MTARSSSTPPADKQAQAHASASTSAISHPRPAAVTAIDRIPRTTLEQWKILETIVEEGSFAQAAERLARSQSSVSYAIARLQEQIGVPLLSLSGRRAVLTDHGRVLLAAARDVLRGVHRLEQLAAHLDRGWEAEVRVAIDLAYPNPALLQALAAFVAYAPHTRLQLREVVLSGAEQALRDGSADLVVGTHVPPGYLGNPLAKVTFVAVAQRDHRLHHLGRAPTMDDLAGEVQVVVRDSGSEQPRDDGWLGAAQRWTVGSMATSHAIVLGGLGFAWLPRHVVREDLDAGRMAVLELDQGRERTVTLYSICSTTVPGPATRHLAELLTEQAAALAD